jgi:hypothetical protein
MMMPLPFYKECNTFNMLGMRKHVDRAQSFNPVDRIHAIAGPWPGWQNYSSHKLSFRG